MMRLTAFLLTFCAITPAFALHCKNDYAGSAGCAANSTPAGDCTTLGFSKSDVAGCSQYLYCMFDTSYKRCISKSDTTCPTGYGRTVKDCGTWSMGWTLGTLDSSGCGKCIKKSCPSGSATTAAGCASGGITGETAYAYSGDDMCKVCQPACSDGYGRTVDDCGRWSNGWTLGTLDSSGCGKCIPKPCPSGTAIAAAGCDSGVTMGSAGVFSGDYMCMMCQTSKKDCYDYGLVDYYPCSGGRGFLCYPIPQTLMSSNGPITCYYPDLSCDVAGDYCLLLAEDCCQRQGFSRVISSSYESVTKVINGVDYSGSCQRVTCGI